MMKFLTLCASAMLLAATTLGGAAADGIDDVGTAVTGSQNAYDWDDTDFSITEGAEIIVVTQALNVRNCAKKTCKVIGSIVKDQWMTLTGETKTLDVGKGLHQQWLQIKYRAPIEDGGAWAKQAWVARTASRSGNKLVLIAEEGDGFSWKSCVSTSDSLVMHSSPDAGSPKIDGGQLHGDERLVIVYDMFKVDKGGRTWWPVSRKWCGDDCFVATGWASDQATGGSTKPQFQCENWPGYDTSLKPVGMFDVDYNVIFAGMKNARR